MKTVCPSCGAVNSLEGLLTDADARLCMKTLSEIPSPALRWVLPYIALFRGTSGRVLQWRRVLTLLTELRDMVISSHVQRGHGAARPNSAVFWAEAMERMVTMPPSRLPLTSHGYLSAMVYDVADKQDRATEIEHNKRPIERSRSEPGKAMTPERMKELKEKALAKISGGCNEK